MRYIVFCLLSICFGAASAFAHPKTPAQATYLGNEGIMVSDGHTTILFDPLFPNGFGVYQMVPDDMRTDLMAGKAPYDRVDAIFVSHMHPDHFSVDEVIKYLQLHKHTRLYAPSQAVEWMHEETDDKTIFDRVISVPLNRLDAPLSYTEGDLSMDVVRIPHAGWPGRADISNLVWRVTLADGVTVMHMGDADPDDTHFAPHEPHWITKRTDTTFPPYWFFTNGDGPQILTERLNSENAIGIHVPLEVPADLFVSGADFLHTPGETRILQRVPEK